MAIISVVFLQYNGGVLANILLLTQAPIVVWSDGTIIVYHYYHYNYVLQNIVFCFLKKNLNASRPSEHLPVRGKNVKTFSR